MLDMWRLKNIQKHHFIPHISQFSRHAGIRGKAKYSTSISDYDSKRAARTNNNGRAICVCIVRLALDENKTFLLKHRGCNAH